MKLSKLVPLPVVIHAILNTPEVERDRIATEALAACAGDAERAQLVAYARRFAVAIEAAW